MLALATDENFNNDIVRGALRRKPDLNVVRVQDAGLSGADDPTVLEWAAQQGRVPRKDSRYIFSYASDRWSNFMKYLPQVIGARYVSGFTVSTRFDDGTEKQIDVSQWFKGPVFEPLKDRKLFKKFFIEAGTLAWPNGVDIAPEALYAARDSKKGRRKKVERRQKTRRSS